MDTASAGATSGRMSLPSRFAYAAVAAVAGVGVGAGTVRALSPRTAPAPVAIAAPLGAPLAMPDGPPVVGILGGMGPAATADLYAKIVAATPAQRDQEHVRVVVWADPTTPDRTAALEGTGPSPVPWLQQGVDRLERSGASFIVVACNTAHAFLPQLTTHVPVVRIMDETARAVRETHPAATRVGLLATRGTVKTRLYQDAFAAVGLAVVVPDEARQAAVSEAIARVKRGDKGPDVTALVDKAGRALAAEQGAEVLVTGCTELPLVYRREDAPVPVVDPTDALARAVVRRAAAARPRL